MADAPDQGTLWLHLKSGHLYVVEGDCQLEAENEPAVLYRRVGGGPLWARSVRKFMDGRFALVSDVRQAMRLVLGEEE